MNHPLPRGWQEKKLNELFNNLNERNHEDKTILASTQDIGVIPNYMLGKDIIRKEDSLSNYKLVKKDCFIISLRSFQGGFEHSNYEGIVSPAYTILEPKINFEPLFYKAYFKSHYFINKSLAKYVEGIRDGKQIRYEECKNIVVPFPPLDEQKRIAEVLSLCDKLIENLTKLIEKKEIYKKGVMQRVLSGEVRFNGFTDEWKEYKLENIGMSYGGLTNKNASDFTDKCNAKYITYKSIYDCNKIDIKRLEDVYIEEDERQNLVQYGDAFFTISSETPDEVAISSVLLDEAENTYLNSFCFGFRFDFNILVPEFARYYFRSNYVRKYTYKLAQGSTRFNLSKNKFLEMIVKLPSIEEQKKIAELLTLIDQDIDNLKQLLHLRKLQKKGVMQKLLTGEVRI